ncbi:hypothetical protein [Thiococcus pfennigii]|uniref:hypothetical protein n=1 Tax=Thiococcus pfennigii TaxID=1057 RepID=UPI0019057B37|nr:hypothetical protein [Thiococcus pfennigii]MBK1732994.1 hypothetical protein [Thiococcus pfennigii]
MTTQPIFAFVDLDDSLLQTREKCRQAPLVEAAYDRAGAPLSFHTPAQLALLDLLRRVTLIPVTGRNLRALRQVRSPRFASYRITSHGALVLGPDEDLLPSWRVLLDAQAARWAGPLAEAAALAEEFIAAERLALRSRVIEDLGVPVYVSIKGPPVELAFLAERIAPHWSTGVVHSNDKNLALLPPFADKAAAVRHLMAEIERTLEVEPVYIGIGDSLTDLPFLRLCHFALVPQHSQIQAHAWAVPGGLAEAGKLGDLG